jgi:hypothetical protein
VRVAYADPPYPGKAARHYRKHPDYAGEVDHVALVCRLNDEYPDGWALSTASTTLRYVLNICPPDVRIGAWVKPYASSRPGVMPVYAWEPLIWRGGRKPKQREGWVRDWVSGNPTRDSTQFGPVKVAGAKPEVFCFWLFQVLGMRRGDTLIDIFPGSGAVTQAWEKWQHQLWSVA